MDFNVFKQAIAKQFEYLQKHAMFRVSMERDAVWDAYLASFPEGTNPIYRERTEHDCSCCRQFVKAVGNAVAIIDGKIVTVWDIANTSEPAYNEVAKQMAKLVKSHRIADVFLHFESKAGADKTLEDLLETAKRRDEPVKKGSERFRTWNHFFANIKAQFVKAGADIPTALAKPRDDHQVLNRSLTELTLEAVDEVLDLIAQNTLYRGAEHKHAVSEFRKLKVEFDKLDNDEARQVFVWTKIVSLPPSICRIRNTSIGTLLIDLSEGLDLENAVRKYEAVVAPANYKRPTALATPKMIEQAKEKVNELGLTSALQRRYATLADITVNDILFVDRTARKALGGDPFAELSASAARINPKSLNRIEEVGIEQFIANILPRASELEVLLETKHASNMVSLIAPVDPTAGRLLKWDNNFSWTYNGDMADSIKERVKAAGGAVEGDLMCRLAWDYRDDLDFHMIEPGGHRIYFGNRRHRSPNGGVLDLDANGADGQRDDPAENIVYADRNRMSEGKYKLQVNNYSRRSDGVGFEVEVEFDSERHNFVCDRVVRVGEYIDVATIQYTKAKGFEIVESMGGTTSAGKGKIMWGLQSQQFHKVNLFMLSPNHWENAQGVGNKHYMLMLDGCKNDTPPRGFLNEQLRDSLTPHRKVFEMLGSKLKVEDSDDQLSGLGFSSTKRDSFIVRVTGATKSTLRVMI